jgi:hypothetical protein
MYVHTPIKTQSSLVTVELWKSLETYKIHGRGGGGEDCAALKDSLNLFVLL